MPVLELQDFLEFRASSPWSILHPLGEAGAAPRSSGRAGGCNAHSFGSQSIAAALAELSPALLPAASEAGGVWEAQDRRGAQGALHSEPHQAGQVSAERPHTLIIYFITAWNVTGITQHHCEITAGHKHGTELGVELLRASQIFLLRFFNGLFVCLLWAGIYFYLIKW